MTAATELWNRVITENDERACEALFFKPYAFWARARKYLRSAYDLTNEEAEDVASNAMSKAFKARDKFNRTKEFEPWFWQIVNNAALDFLRLSSRKHEVSMDDHPSVIFMADPATLNQPHRRDYASVLEIVLSLSELSQRERQVMILMSEGLSAEEVCESLSIDIEEFQTNRSEARRKLSKGMQKMRSRRTGESI